jgi:glutamate/tyrosine decarboxylase-like PLP-dependent enzyme
MPHDPVPELLARAAETLDAGFAEVSKIETLPGPDTSVEAMAEVLAETARRLSDNYPYFHPLYAGQMLKPPHPLARAAYALAMKINPNNHARDGGRASSEMEIEAVSQIAAIFGWKEFLGHLTSGGTFANLEALWVAGQLRPGERIVGSAQAHYTHQRISGVLKLDYAAVAADNRGRMSLEALENELHKGGVGTVVATLGTTAIGAVDPLDGILALKKKYGFRVHVDAAYGGYFKLIEDELDEPARRAYAAISEADSIVVDPHKHGLQPFGCGCVLFRDRGVGRLYKHDSPYTYFTSKQLHLGEISLECSRAGAAAVALWATHRMLPPVPGGAFAAGLAKGRRAALELDRRLRNDARFVALGSSSPRSQNRDLGHPVSIPPSAHSPLRRDLGRPGSSSPGPELDIVCWALAAATPEEASERAQKIFDAAAVRGLHLALVQLPGSWFPAFSQLPESGSEAPTITCLRSVLMKPEHEAWLGEIWQRLSAATTEVTCA